MNLTQELENTLNAFKNKAPAEVKDEMQKAYEELVSKEIGASSLGVNDIFPDFKLSNQTNKVIQLNDLVKGKDFLIISFYRGGWCPYCNLELKALQQYRQQFSKFNTELVAITPELPDQSLNTSEKNSLDFQVLSDSDSILCEALRISFKLPDNLKPLYQKFGIDIPKHNGENNFTLPIPATFLIDRNKKIVFAFKDLDYTKRLDPNELIQILKDLNA